MSIGPIELTDSEQVLHRLIVFEPGYDFGPERTNENGESAARLFQSLLRRSAIPEARLRYFADPIYHAGNTKSSRYELFLRNVASDEDMQRNPHFLKYLRYFINGADLPQPIQEAFQAKCRDHFVRVHELSSFARQLMRDMRRRVDPIDRYRLPDEFYKLALDCGCDATDAQTVRRAVMQLK